VPRLASERDRTKNRSDRGIPHKLDCKHTTCLYRHCSRRTPLILGIATPSSFRTNVDSSSEIEPSPTKVPSFECERLNDDIVEMSKPCTSPRLPHSATSATVKPDLDPTRSNEVREYYIGVPVVRNVNSLRIEASRLLTRIATPPRWCYSTVLERAIAN